MKTSIKNLLLLAALTVGSSRVTAQTFTTLYSFTNGNDGATPFAGLVLTGKTLFGTAESGGSSGNGTVFAVNTDGTNFTTLHSFTPLSTHDANSDGANPWATLVLSGNTLYGTAEAGGSSGNGTVFSVSTNGTNFTTLYSFTNGSDGAFPYAGLILSGNTLYGTAEEGGSSGYGTVFSVSTNGTNFTTLYSFTNGSDGAFPYAGLILSGDTLYGTASGGISGSGTVFAVNTNGMGFTNLYSFTATVTTSKGYTNSDGAGPLGIILSGNILYGTAGGGGGSGTGTVFAVNTNGTDFTNLHSFAALSGGIYATNNEGAEPKTGLILAGNNLYGTAELGGSSGFGTVFAVNTDGTDFTNLHSFTATASGFPNSSNSDGAIPHSTLILSGNTLFGTAEEGGSSGFGTVFSLSVPAPQLTIIPYGVYVILTWPTSPAGFTLQSNASLASPTAWTTVSPGPVVISGQNIVVNPIFGPQMFYRLSQ